ncbi:MAG TPA: ribulose-phosphate 3-epimerase [Anaerolineales bacterium]|nr:ribulose-phosphate 3-epimerase [Anaerolineales bacterium]
MIHISASLLAADYARLGEEMQRAEKAGVDSFHFDMMDGHYVPNLALTPHHLKALRVYSNLAFHVHLELANPDDVLSTLNFIQADLIIVQWNTLTDPARTFDRIRSQNKKVGLGLNPDDACEETARFIPDIDLLVLLGVYPGFGGQVMQPATVEKIITARRLADSLEHKTAVAVDGGVKPGNAAQLVEAGADFLIMGTALFQSADMAETIKSIRESTARSQRHSPF